MGEGGLFGRSLTPESSSKQVTSKALSVGALNGICTLLPTMAIMHQVTVGSLAKHFTINNWTNTSARTAMCIMPGLFVFALTSELEMSSLKRQEADRLVRSGALSTSEDTGEKKMVSTPVSAPVLDAYTSNIDETRRMWRKEYNDEPVRIVSRLGFAQRAANFVHEYPFRVIAGVGIPMASAVLFVQTGKGTDHLKFSQKLMHTRVYAQTGAIGLLMGVMMFKTWMDRQGLYMTEAEVRQMLEEERAYKEQYLAALKKGETPKSPTGGAYK